MLDYEILAESTILSIKDYIDTYIEDLSPDYKSGDTILYAPKTLAVELSFNPASEYTAKKGLFSVRLTVVLVALENHDEYFNYTYRLTSYNYLTKSQKDYKQEDLHNLYKDLEYEICNLLEAGYELLSKTFK